MINLKFLNAAIGQVSTDEFAVLYVICNNPKIQKEGRARLHREVMAEILGWLNDKRPEYSLKKVTRITNSLVEKGWLKKDVVYESPQKSVNYYSICTQKIEEKCTSSEQKSEQKLGTSTQKSVPLNKKKKDEIKQHNTNNTEKNEKRDASELSFEEQIAALPF